MELISITKQEQQNLEFEDTIKKYIDLGIQDFSLPDNATLQYEWYKKNSEKLKGILDKSF